MNSKKAKSLRRIAKASNKSNETLYRVIRNNTLSSRQFLVDPSCKRGLYREMKKALPK